MTSIPLEGTGAGRGAYLPLSRGDKLVLCLMASYALLAVILLKATGAEQAFAFGAYIIVWPFVFLVLFPFIYCMLVLLRIVHRLPSLRGRKMALRRALSRRYMQPFATGLLIMAGMVLFQGAFTSIKSALPLWQGDFPYDLAQADIDRAIHFGIDPWRYLVSLGSNEWLRWIVEWNYSQGWFIFCYGVLFLVAISARASAIRTRYFVTYMVAWVAIGNMFACIFLSAGPAFYGSVTGDASRFGEQLAFLAQGEAGQHSARYLQIYLWDLHDSGTAGFGSGISAFPSMHVALVMLNALFVMEVDRKWGAVALGYVAFVLASSVYLAWHYAIDGYVAIILTVLIYLAVKTTGLGEGKPSARA